ILAKGNLISQVALQGALCGVVAADGDIGVIQTANGQAVLKRDGSLTRFGGICSGPVGGQIIALGDSFGDISITCDLSGPIAVKGNQGEFGLPAARFGILGNITICGGITTTGAVISSGLIGDNGTSNTYPVNKTDLSISNADKGIVAAGGDIALQAGGKVN